MFYFLKEGTKWKNIILHFSPLSDESGNKILDKLHIAVNGIIKGYLLIAVVQGVLMGLGLLIFGVPNAALWGVLTAVASLIPTVGTALVSVPAVLFLFILGKNGAAIGLAIWAGALVGTIDNMLSPLFVGKKIAIHPLLVLFSVLGGIALMGPIGILVGPLVISFMYALASVYKTETLI
jgi:predicted PurR-regulated permease PerM